MFRQPFVNLPIVDALVASGTLRGYPWLWAVRGDLLARLVVQAKKKDRSTRG